MNIDEVLKNHGIGVGGGSNIKSVQRGTITLPGNTNTVDITINEVDISKSIVKITFYNSETTAIIASIAIKGKLLNSTTLQLSRYASNYGIITASWEVIELQNIKSLQIGESIFNGYDTTLSTTINSIDITKSTIVYSFDSAYASAHGSALGLEVVLSENKIDFYRKQSNTSVIYWYVIEFK